MKEYQRKGGRVMQWYCKAVGGVLGYVNEDEVCLVNGQSYEPDSFPHTLKCEKGKLGDSEDSFLYVYGKVRAREESFRLTVSLSAESISEHFGKQSGYGLMLADTEVSGSKRARHRNYLFAGWLGSDPCPVVKAVAGYTDPKAEDGRGRIVDMSRRFQLKQDLKRQEGFRQLSIEKTNEGLTISWEEQKIFIPGCGFLLQQDPENLFAGVALARGVRTHIENVSFEKSPGKASETPDGVIRMHLPVDSFSEKLLHAEALPTVRSEGIIYVSPSGEEGATGSREDPMTLQHAVLSAKAGAEICLLEGVYELREPLVIPRECSGAEEKRITLKAETRRKAILFGESPDDLPVMVIGGDFWNVEGLVFQNSRASGLVVCGNHNRIMDCEAHHNGDTGILIKAPMETERSKWPAFNEVRGCDSYENADPDGENADGFGAKLRIGEGNQFVDCLAYRNADDGFDLYNKSLYGPGGAVKIDSCAAMENGFALRNGQRVRGTGVGFKLGGEFQAVAHEARNCVAIRNASAGFSNNNNPACRIIFCTDAENGPRTRASWRKLLKEKLKPEKNKDGSLYLKRLPSVERMTLPHRLENGELDWEIRPRGLGKTKSAGAMPLVRRNR